MGAPKGHKRYGGRQKGTTNKTTAKIKECVINLVCENMTQIKDDLKQLTPKERLNILERLLNYCIPKKSTTTVKADIETIIDNIENED